MARRRERLSRWRASSNGFLCAVVILLSLLVLSYSVHRGFDHDEFEHIHSAWYVANGYTPYTDFFQNHHPLLWYCLVPVLRVLGYSTRTVAILRTAMFGLTLGIAFLTFLMAQRVTSSTTASLLSVLLLLSMVMFLEKSVEIRPAVPQALLGVLSVYFFVRFLQRQSNLDTVLAGVCASLSFLFQPRTIFLLIAYALILCYGLVRRRTPFASIVWFVMSFSLPAVLFLAYLLLSGSFQDYLLTNWLVNIHWLDTFSPMLHLRPSFVTQNALFWVLSPASIAFILLSREPDKALKATAVIGIVLLLSALSFKAPNRQYFMFAIPLLCIAIGYLIERVVDRLGLRGIHMLILVIVVLSQPLLFLAPRSISSGLRDKQLERVEFVLDNSGEYDPVYDGDAQFNLFRPDLHYFWYSLSGNEGLDTYNLITHNKYGDYDICQLVRSQQPRFISDYRLRLARCGLRPFYNDTPFPSLYVWNDQLEGQHLLWRDLGHSVALIGYAAEPEAGQGRLLHLSLWWEGLSQMDRDYTVFIHVVDQDGRIWAQRDIVLQHGGYPTSTWLPGETVREEYELELPRDTPPGNYIVKTGVYYWETGERLPVWDESRRRLPEDTIVLEQISVTE
jgi:hypothetical protein